MCRMKEKWNELTVRQKAILIASAIGGICFVVFITQNTENVEVDVLFWKINLSIILLIFVSALLGALLMLAYSLSARIKLKKELEAMKQKIQELEIQARIDAGK